MNNSLKRLLAALCCVGLVAAVPSCRWRKNKDKDRRDMHEKHKKGYHHHKGEKKQKKSKKKVEKTEESRAY